MITEIIFDSVQFVINLDEGDDGVLDSIDFDGMNIYMFIPKKENIIIL